MEIQSAKNIQLDSLTILLQGFSGSGKTFTARTHGDDTKVLVLSLESGHFTLKGSNVDYLVIDGTETQKLAKLSEFMTNLDKYEYDFYYIDSLTEVAQCLVELATQKFPQESHALKLWKFYNEQMTKLIKKFRDLKKNVVFTVLLKDEKDNLGRRYFTPDVSGGIKNRLGQYFDFVFTLQTIENEKKEKKRVVLTQCFDGNTCKSRSQNLEMYEPANMQQIINKIQGE